MEAGAGEGSEGLTVAPIEGEESARFSRGGAGDRGFLDEGDGGASFGQEVSGANADDAAAAYDDSFWRVGVHR